MIGIGINSRARFNPLSFIGTTTGGTTQRVSLGVTATGRVFTSYRRLTADILTITSAELIGERG
jgi:hypothetical protein